MKYFDSLACLAQSPQLYKQICAACSDFMRVFEVGPVFRAEDSNTNRHLCEFTGLDLEMTIKDHYHEVVELLHGLFVYIFKNIEEKYSKEIETIKTQYGFEPLQYTAEPCIIPFPEGIEMLKQHGIDANPLGDLT